MQAETVMSEMIEQKIPDNEIYQRALDRFLGDFSLADGAVLSTEDGLMVASYVQNNSIEPEAIAAMSASMLALADALAGQAGRAFADNIISEAESCTLVVLHAGELILTVVGQANENIGMILSTARKTANFIERSSKEDDIVFKGHEILKDPEALMERVKHELQELRNQ